MGINVHKKRREKRKEEHNEGKRGTEKCNQKVNTPETVTVVISIMSQGLRMKQHENKTICLYIDWPIFPLPLFTSLPLSLSLPFKKSLVKIANNPRPQSNVATWPKPVFPRFIQENRQHTHTDDRMRDRVKGLWGSWSWIKILELLFSTLHSPVGQ